jgi:predicted metal-binding protein
MKQKVLSHKKALVLSTKWKIGDFSQTDRIRQAKNMHNAAMFRLIEKMRAQGHIGFMIGASGCSLCKPCKLTLGIPCEHPERMYSCMSAYCIYVKRLAEDCGIVYDYKDGILPFFGMYVFD